MKIDIIPFGIIPIILDKKHLDSLIEEIEDFVKFDKYGKNDEDVISVGCGCFGGDVPHKKNKFDNYIKLNGQTIYLHKPQAGCPNKCRGSNHTFMDVEI